jgi:hypothetical protein
MSRDQMVCSYAGYKKDGAILCESDYSWFAPNGDILFWPSVRNHFKICCRQKPSWIGFQFLKLDIWYNAHFAAHSEPNQLICMLMTAGPEYVRRWKKANTLWKEAIQLYWNPWREPDGKLAQLMIDTLEKI